MTTNKKLLITIATLTTSIPSFVHGWTIPQVISTTSRSRSRGAYIKNNNNRIKSIAINSRVQDLQQDDDTFTGTEIDINAVLLEADNALQAAEESLEENDDNDNYVYSNSNSNSNNNYKKAATKTVKGDIESFTIILSTTIGGSLLGFLSGSLFAFDTKELLYTAFPTPVVYTLPILFGISVGGIIGFMGGTQEDNSALGNIIRAVLGRPVQALASAIVDSVQLSISRQVDKTTSNIKAIPSKIAKSAQGKAEQTAKEVKSRVIITVESTFNKLLEQLKKVLLFSIAFTSVIVVGIFFLDG